MCKLCIKQDTSLVFPVKSMDKLGIDFLSIVLIRADWLLHLTISHRWIPNLCKSSLCRSVTAIRDEQSNEQR